MTAARLNDADCLRSLADRLADRPDGVDPEDYDHTYPDAEDRRMVLQRRLLALADEIEREE